MRVGGGNGLDRRLEGLEIGLGLRKISRLQILAELREFLLEVLEIGLRGRRIEKLENAAAGDTGNRHEWTPWSKFGTARL